MQVQVIQPIMVVLVMIQVFQQSHLLLVAAVQVADRLGLEQLVVQVEVVLSLIQQERVILLLLILLKVLLVALLQVLLVEVVEVAQLP